MCWKHQPGFNVSYLEGEPDLCEKVCTFLFERWICLHHYHRLLFAGMFVSSHNWSFTCGCNLGNQWNHQSPVAGPFMKIWGMIFMLDLGTYWTHMMILTDVQFEYCHHHDNPSDLAACMGYCSMFDCRVCLPTDAWLLWNWLCYWLEQPYGVVCSRAHKCDHICFVGCSKWSIVSERFILKECVFYHDYYCVLTANSLIWIKFLFPRKVIRYICQKCSRVQPELWPASWKIWSLKYGIATVILYYHLLWSCATCLLLLALACWCLCEACRIV